MFNSTFAHRLNLDKTWDSFCRACAATVANAESETGLLTPEAFHVCNEQALKLHVQWLKDYPIAKKG